MASTRSTEVFGPTIASQLLLADTLLTFARHVGGGLELTDKRHKYVMVLAHACGPDDTAPYTMIGTYTLLVAAQDAALIPQLRRRHPQLHALSIGPEIPLGGIEGPLWCFVDWLLPDISGLEMVRRLREAKSTRHGHITMVLEDSDPEGRRRALKAGADDYLLGPLDATKLTERLALYEAAAQPSPASRARLINGDLSIDLAAHQLRFRGTAIPLRPNEFRLLAHFMENPDQVFSRAALIDRLGKDEETIDDRTVDVWVGRLRRALAAHHAPDPLRTVRSLGYVMDSLGD